MITGKWSDQDFHAPDAREYDPRLCARYFTNGTLEGTTNGSRAGTLVLVQPTSNGNGTAQVISQYDNKLAQFIRLFVPTGGLRNWISDRISLTNTNLLFGAFEMDCTARVRFLKGRDTDTVTNARVGYMGSHWNFSGSLNPVDGQNTAMFSCVGTQTTWQVVIFREGDIGGPAKQIDSKVPVSDWNVLHVWGSKDGKLIRFFINNKLIWEETDVSAIPSYSSCNKTPENAAVVGFCLQSGCCVRGASTAGAGNEAKLDIDWCRSRFFFEGGR